MRLARLLTRGIAAAGAVAGVALVFGLFQAWPQGASAPPQVASQAIEARMAAGEGASIGPTLARAVNEAPSPGGPQEGIKVHGQWTIEVRNPDGSLASHQDFENALQSTGARALSKVLARSSSAGWWQVLLNGSPEVCVYASQPYPCFLFETSAPAFGTSNTFNTLTVTSPSSPDPDTGKLVLKGTATGGANGNIVNVATYLYLCNANNAPATPCDSGTMMGEFMTSANISPISVQNGQQVLVTVKISFS